MNQTRDDIYDSIIGELNRINVSNDLKEVVDLTHYLQVNVKKYIEQNIYRITEVQKKEDK